MSGIIPIEHAITQRFENSTREELLEYAEHLGLTDVRPTADIPSIKNRLFMALGIVERAIPMGGNGAKIFRSKIIPDVNLTPSGAWGGRRRRIKVPRPAWATKSERAMPVGWNGKATYWVPFDEPVDVPYPIYNILIQTQSRRPIQKEVDGPGGSTEITTDWEFSDFAMSDMGDSPKTVDLPRSLTEWYQNKGPKFFMDLSSRDAIMVADRCDINTNGKDGKRLSHGEIIDLVLVFLFGVAADGMEFEGEEGAGAASEAGAGFQDPMTT